jgi:hypothetical protein
VNGGEAPRGGCAAGISVLAIATCGRPRLAASCLAGYMRNATHFGRAPRFVISDDTAPGPEAAEIRTMAAKASHDCGAKVVVVGRPERAAMVEELVRALHLPPEMLAFGLLGEWRGAPGRTLGAARNGLILSTVGNNLVMVDDDTLCAAYRMDDCSREVTVSATSETHLWFFPTRALALANARPVTLDLLGAHQTLLARSLTEARGSPAREAADGHLDWRARVAVTMLGSVGDSALWAPQFLNLAGESRRRMVITAEAYATAQVSREIIRLSLSPVITDSGFCMGMATGLANDRLLPPFFPVGRNSDGVFGVCLVALDPFQLTGHLPWAIHHAPPETRTYEPIPIHEVPAAFRSSDLMSLLIRAAARSIAAVKRDRCRALGLALRELGNSTVGEFQSCAIAELNALWTRRLQALRRTLQRYGAAPGYWARDATAAIHTLESKVSATRHLVPRDLEREADPAARMRELVALYGDLLVHWPEIWQAAPRLLAGVS